MHPKLTAISSTGIVTYIYIVYELLFSVRNRANSLGSDIHKAYLIPAALESLIWLIYPIAWGVCEGGNVIAPDSEAVFYGILDIATIICIPALLLFSLRDIDLARLVPRGPRAEASVEKAAHQNGTNGAGGLDSSEAANPVWAGRSRGWRGLSNRNPLWLFLNAQSICAIHSLLRTA